MKHQLADGLELNYEIHGQAEAKQTLVFLNGLSQPTLAWGPYLPAFQKNYKIVLLDLIFQGQSDAAEHYRSFDQHAQDVSSLLEGLQIESANFVGISYGGAVLMRLMVNHPEKVAKGVIMASFAYKTPMFEAQGLAWRNALQAGGYPLMLDVMLPMVLSNHYYENPVMPIDMMKTARRDLHPSTEQLLKLMETTQNSEDYRDELTKVKCPVLVIAGEEDRLCTPEMNQAIAEAIPEARLEKIPQAGHTLNLEAVPKTVELMVQFFENG